MSDPVPSRWRARNPLIDRRGHELLTSILQHPAAPRWNYEVGDRIRAGDLEAVDSFRELCGEPRPPWRPPPPQRLLERLEVLRRKVELFAERLAGTGDLARDWALVPTTDRDDLARRVTALIPRSADLERLIVYATSGTTGHALTVPHHPVAMARNQSLLERALERHGVAPDFGPGRVACVNLGSQEPGTAVFATLFSIWRLAGFAKVNLDPRDWRDADHPAVFLGEMAPRILTGDPAGFAVALDWDLPVRPAALISTAATLTGELRERLAARFGCPVIDWYSTTETGPLACSCPAGRGLHLLPPDIHVEIVDPSGAALPPGESGEIAVTGGRNPYLPLLRYRTGDRARLEVGPCPCGDGSPRLVGLEARELVYFRRPDGSRVNSVDLGRVLRELPVLCHECVQRADGSFRVRLAPVPGGALAPSEPAARLREILGRDAAIEVEIDRNLGAGGARLVPYRRERA